ncbi:unnamed protein product [Leuciscus chuanchicus]
MGSWRNSMSATSLSQGKIEDQCEPSCAALLLQCSSVDFNNVWPISSHTAHRTSEAKRKLHLIISAPRFIFQEMMPNPELKKLVSRAVKHTEENHGVNPSVFFSVSLDLLHLLSRSPQDSLVDTSLSWQSLWNALHVFHHYRLQMSPFTKPYFRDHLPPHHSLNPSHKSAVKGIARHELCMCQLQSLFNLETV